MLKTVQVFLFVFLFLLSSCADPKLNMDTMMSEGAGNSMMKNLDAMDNEAGDPTEDVLKSYLEDEAPHPGASRKGRVFDFGPRQFPSRQPQSPALKFPITSCTDEATLAFNRGISFIYAFELIEAEKQFRYAFHLDENCTMALWGAGLTHITFGMGDYARGLKFAKLAQVLTAHKGLKLSDIEVKLLDILLRHLSAPTLAANQSQFVDDWLKLSLDYPAEIELKALGGYWVWQYNEFENQKLTQDAVSRIFDEVLEQVPLHPVHHAKIHLWNDQKNEKKALDSAEKIGLSFLDSAHMWHMAAHVYHPIGEPLKAVEQFKLAALIDQRTQAELIEFPYTLHNYGHNQNYWSFISTEIGAYKKSARLAKGLLKMSLHPKYNNPEKNDMVYKTPYIAGIANLVALSKYSDNHDFLLLAEEEKLLSVYPLNFKNHDVLIGLYTQLAWAHIKSAHTLESYKYRLLLKDIAITDAILLDKRSKSLQLLDLLDRYYAGENSVELIDDIAQIKATTMGIVAPLASSSVLAKFYRLARAPEKALDALHAAVPYGNILTNKVDIMSLVEKAHAHLQLAQTEEAQSAFNRAKAISAQLDEDSETYALGREVAQLLNENTQWKEAPPAWRLPLTIPADFNGDEIIHPLAQDFRLTSALKQQVSLFDEIDKADKGVVLVFVLGGSCAACDEQLGSLNKYKKQIEKLGYRIVAITTDSAESMQNTFEGASSKNRVQYQLLSDADFKVFKQYKSYDDFEALPLHGTYVIQKDKQINFIDRGALPFKDIEWLLREIKRLDSF